MPGHVQELAAISRKMQYSMLASRPCHCQNLLTVCAACCLEQAGAADGPHDDGARLLGGAAGRADQPPAGLGRADAAGAGAAPKRTVRSVATGKRCISSLTTSQRFIRLPLM